MVLFPYIATLGTVERRLASCCSYSSLSQARARSREALGTRPELGGGFLRLLLLLLAPRPKTRTAGGTRRHASLLGRGIDALLALCHAGHHGAHGLKLREEGLGFLEVAAGAFGDALYSGRGGLVANEELGVDAFLPCHGVDEAGVDFRFRIGLLDFVRVDAAHAREQLGDVGEVAHVLDGVRLREVVVEIKAPCDELAHLLFGVLLGDALLGLLDEGDDVAHAEDARGHPAGIERFEVRHFFADADELHRDVRHRAHGEGGAAPCVAVEFR
mmetsp:Transcript_8039/g.26421  ORF Transcript_8039/g.26421 Transcript_8039/m.26421 type:complete len:272 (-) Transcript_8039:924-1739(-)